MATILNLSHDQGTTFKATVTVKSDLGVATNLTGYTFRGQARLAYGSEASLINFVFTVLDQTTNAGKFLMKILPAATESLNIKAVTKYLYDVEMVSPDSEVTRIFEGALTVHPEVTK